MTDPIHPGTYIRDKVIPPKMAVKEAAKLLGVGRPALSNLLNGNADLSPEMAARLEKVFGADHQELLKMQVAFDQSKQGPLAQNLPVGAYVPSFLKVTARDIEHWADGNLEARSLLPVLLRKLVNSTGQDLSAVDFPGYDQAEKKGWDGRVDAGAATPWIPTGKSVWEFGCNEDPKQKADGDYAARVKAIPAADRAEMHFVFVTPRKWNGKDKWLKEKRALGEWKSVRAYDAGDLEQWIEQSLQAQGWLSEKRGSHPDGVSSLEEKWRVWSSVTHPELAKELFAPAVDTFKKDVERWMKNPSTPLIVAAGSKLEALAFLNCMFDDPAFENLKDRILVFSSAGALRKLTTPSPAFIPIVITDEAERAVDGAFKNRPVIIIRPSNTVELGATIVLDRLRYEPFQKALEAMGINDHLKVDELARECGYSPTILRRRLATIPAIRTPEWAQDSSTVRRLIPIMLVGAWHTQSKGDCEIMRVLADKSCEEIEQDVTELLKFDDPPAWSEGKFRGVASKIDAFFAVQASVTRADLENLLLAAEIVLSEKDPTLDLPEDKRAFANLYGKSREHSGALREGLCETLVLLAVHGNDLFKKRLGFDVQVEVDMLVRRLLTPLSPEKLHSQTGNLPMYAEAAPQEFLRIIEDDLNSAEPQVYSLMKPADTGIFGGGCPRTGLLWALENLAWKADQLPRVALILARLAQRKIDDNWANKPGKSLEAIFRSWMPQTAASMEDRQKVLELLTKKEPEIGWQLCLAQIQQGHQVGDYSHRPKWRSDASGAGQPLKTWGEIIPFCRKATELALAWPTHDEKTLGDLVSNLRWFSDEDQEVVWGMVEKWAATAKDDAKAVLRERIRRSALLRRSVKQGVPVETRDRARKVYDLLLPSDLVGRHRWLFEQQWVEESFDELEGADFDYEKREAQIRDLRITALQEVWKGRGFGGIEALLSKSGAAFVIGWHMAEGVVASAEAAGFVEQCLKVSDQELTAKFDQVIRGFTYKLEPDVRAELTQALAIALPPALMCRLLKSSPFQHDTWAQADAHGDAIREQYWREVIPDFVRRDSPDLNEALDRLLDARRPRAAFAAVHFALKEVETSRLRRLLEDIGTCDAEPHGTYQVEAYYLSDALSILQNRVGVTEEEMARLEFRFVTALEHEAHGIPNLEKQVGKSPALFVQSLALLYRRNDGGEDPPEWQVKDEEKSSALGTAVYRLLENIRRIPGTNDAGGIDEKALLAWVKEAQSLAAQHGRADVGDQNIGRILSAAPVGTDGIWPCEAVRSVMEECGTAHMARGFQIGVFNSRGVHARGEGGEQERALVEKYRNWSRKLRFEYPYVATTVDGIAEDYARQAGWEDSETAVRRRLGH